LYPLQGVDKTCPSRVGFLLSLLIKLLPTLVLEQRHIEVRGKEKGIQPIS